MSKKRDKALADASMAVAEQMAVTNRLNVAFTAKVFNLTDEQNDRLLKGVGL